MFNIHIWWRVYMIHTRNMRVDGMALLIPLSRGGSRLTSSIEVLLSTELFPRKLSGT
jgi:hypothetical protein